MPLRRWRVHGGAYQQTLYTVYLPRGELVLQPGRRNLHADLRLWREAGAHKPWVILSASNPRSRLLSETWNTLRFNQLKRLIVAGHHRVFHSTNRDPKAQWPDEHGLWVCGISARAAATLGRRFGQNAVLAGGPGLKAKLLWL